MFFHVPSLLCCPRTVGSYLARGNWESHSCSGPYDMHKNSFHPPSQTLLVGVTKEVKVRLFRGKKRDGNVLWKTAAVDAETWFQ